MVSVPAFTSVAPVKEFTPAKASVPELFFVSEPVPVMAPEKVWLALLL